jgi:hypothetical protein
LFDSTIAADFLCLLQSGVNQTESRASFGEALPLTLVPQMQSQNAVLIIDDSIAEKPYTDKNALICQHYDHSKDKDVKNINCLTALYSTSGQSSE